jgi:hypothetical protein
MLILIEHEQAKMLTQLKELGCTAEEVNADAAKKKAKVQTEIDAATEPGVGDKTCNGWTGNFDPEDNSDDAKLTKAKFIEGMQQFITTQASRVIK